MSRETWLPGREASHVKASTLAGRASHHHTRGLRLAIDDFGTGYSSLGRLSALHVSSLKIDRSYISDLPGDRDACILVETMVTLSQKLGLQCLAEGIETEAQLRFLQDLGCPLGQGYLFSRPLPSSDFARLIGGDQKAA